MCKTDKPFPLQLGFGCGVFYSYPQQLRPKAYILQVDSQRSIHSLRALKVESAAQACTSILYPVVDGPLRQAAYSVG